MVEYDECGNEIKKNKRDKCKYFHQDPDLTPNNYDLFFDYNNIPANIPLEGKSDLIRQLKKCLPLSKRLHLNLETENISHDNAFNIYTRTKFVFKRLDENDGEMTVRVDVK